MSLVAVSIINVALPSIRGGLGASDSDLQWVLSGYTLTFGVVMVAAGRAGDLLGRKRIFIIGVSLFGLSSLVAALAPNPLVLNVSRALMGLTAGLYSPQVAGIIQQHFEGKERAKAFAMFGAVVGSAVAIGPLLGGALVEFTPGGHGWRSTLGINVPLAALTVGLGLAWLPKNRPVPGRRHDLDPVGAIILGGAVLCIMMPFILTNSSSPTWFLLPAGVALLGAWLAWEVFYGKRGKSPMVNLNLFKIKSYIYGAALISIQFMGGPAIWILINQFVQDGLGYSAIISGMVGLPAAIASIYFAYLGGNLIVTMGRKLIIAGLSLQILGIILTALVAGWIEDGWSVWLLSVATFPIGIGAAWITAPNNTLSLRHVPKENGGTAAAIMQTGQRIGTAIGTAAVTGLFFAQVRDGYAHALTSAYLLITAFSLTALAIAIADHRRGRGEPFV